VQDLVILAVKGPAIAGVAAQVAALCGPHTRVLTALNGLPWWFTAGLPVPGLALESVDPGGRIAALIPPERVIGCVVHARCYTEAPGHVRHVMGNGLLIGEAVGGASESVNELAALLAGAGFGAKAVDSIQREVFYKLWGNMTTNPVSALTRATTDRILADELVREFTTAIMREAAVIGERVGCPIAQSPQDRHAITRSLGAFKTSMLQDIEAGRAIETDALLAAPRELARQLGIATPMLDALLGLTRLMDGCRASA
jgi:2-dehydropantoate 2-reductase